MQTKAVEKKLSEIEIVLKINKSNKKILSVYETSVYYGITETKIKSWIRRNIVPHFEIENETLIHKDVLDAWLLGKFSWENIDKIELKFNLLSDELALVSKKVSNINIPSPTNYTIAFLFLFLFQIAIIIAISIK